jgi:hypothetical protein
VKDGQCLNYASGGDVTVTSEPGKGSVFTVRLPTHAAARLAALAEEADDDEEREYYIRMRDAWITLANRCEFMPISDVTEE